MRSKKAFYVLLGVTIVMVAAAVVSQRSANEPALSHGLHAPGLESRVDAVRTVLIRTADKTLRLERADEGWVARSKTGHPANVDRIRQLVLGISRLERLESKTSNPERYQRLELRDIEAPGSKAVRVTLLSGDGDALADVLVGKTEDFQQEARSRYFVRDADDSQAWLVEGSLPPVLEETSSWLERSLLPGVGETDLASVVVTHGDGNSVAVRRADGETNFQLAGLAADEAVNSPYTVNAVAETFRRLSLKDVHAADAAPEEAIATVEARTFNGVRVVARVGPAEPDYTLELRADYDPDHGATGDDGEPEADGARLAGDLNELWRGRSFVVSQYALDDVLVRRADLLKQPESSGAE